MPPEVAVKLEGRERVVALTVIHSVLFYYLVRAVITCVEIRVGLGSPRGSSVHLGPRELHW